MCLLIHVHVCLELAQLPNIHVSQKQSITINRYECDSVLLDFLTLGPKVDYIIAFAEEIDAHDLILSLPEDNTFNALKKALVKITIISEQQ